MAFVVDYIPFDSFLKDMKNNGVKHMERLENVKGTVGNLVDANEFSGKGSESIKRYFQTVHINIMGSLYNASNVLAGNCALYRQGYRNEIDLDNHAVIKETELDSIKSTFNGYRNNIDSVNTSINTTLNGISDLFSHNRQDVSRVISTSDSIINRTKNLKEKIPQYEKKHYNNDFSEVEATISSTKALIEELMTKDRAFKETFTKESLASISSWGNFVDGATKIQDTAEKNKESYAEAYENENKVQEELKKERENKMKPLKWAIAGATIVASAAVVVVTGGAATPLLVAAVGGVTAAAASVGNDLIDAYVEDGDLHNVDAKTVIKNAIVEGGTEFTTSLIGGTVLKSLGGKVTKLVKLDKLMNSYSASVGQRVFGKTVTGAVKGVVKGEIKAITKEAISQTFDVVVDGEEYNIKKLKDSALDGKARVKDFVKGAITGATSELIDCGLEKTHIDAKLNDDSASVRGKTAFFTEGGKSVVTGMEGRFTDNVLDDALNGNWTKDSWGNAVKKTFDTEEIVKDLFTGGTEGAGDAYYDQNIVGQEVSKKDLKNPKIMDKIPKDVVSNPKNWIDRGGKIYMDSNGKVTFQARAMKTRPDEDKELLRYGNNGKTNYDRSTAPKNTEVIGGHFSYKNRPKVKTT